MEKTAEETVGRVVEIYEFLGKVDGDAVEADDREEQRPSAPSANVYQVIEKGKQQQRVGSDDEYEAAGP